MEGPRLVIVDLPALPGCNGSCARIGALARDAVAPARLELAILKEVPLRSEAPAPDVVVVRTRSGPLLEETVGALRATWRSSAILAAVCPAVDRVPGVLDRLRELPDDFFCCPCSDAEIQVRLRRLLPGPRLRPAERAALLRDLVADGLVGEHDLFLRALVRLERIATSTATVLIAGETGAGKELFARAVHYNGARRARPFIPVNCGAVPAHLFENELFGHAKGAFTDASTSAPGVLAEADGGTVFLDEVDTLAIPVQAKLLRFLQDGEYRPLGASRALRADVRVIAATNADLSELVAARQFRQDLYHRLDVLSLRVPALRDRATDIPLLASHFLARHAAEYGRPALRLSRAAVRKLLAYRWPGNVRELDAVLHRAVVFAGSELIGAEEIELPAAPPSPYGAPARSQDRAMDEFEREYLAALLAEHHGNVSRVARAAGRDRRSVQRALQRHCLVRSAFQRAS